MSHQVFSTYVMIAELSTFFAHPLVKAESTVVVPNPLVQRDGTPAPATVAEQLALQSPPAVGEPHIPRRGPEVANVAAAATPATASVRDLDDLAGVDHVRVLDAVVAGDVLERAAEPARDAAQGIAGLDGHARRGAAAVVAPARGPAEAALVVLDDAVQADAALLVGAVDALAGGVQHVLAVGVETDVA